MDLAGIYQLSYPNTEEYIFYSVAHGTLKQITCQYTKQVSTNTKMIEITLYILCGHNAIKLKVNNNKKKLK